MDQPREPLTTCAECAGPLLATTGAGHEIPYAGVMVPLPDDFPITYCARCGAIGGEDGDAFRAIEPELARRAAARIQRATG